MFTAPGSQNWVDIFSVAIFHLLLNLKMYAEEGNWYPLFPLTVFPIEILSHKCLLGNKKLNPKDTSQLKQKTKEAI